MFLKKSKHLDNSQSSNEDGIYTNTPGVQSRRIITPFVEKRGRKTENTRNLDDFQRAEGYRPFTPRQLGISREDNKLSTNPELEVLSLPDQTASRTPLHGIKWFRRRHHKQNKD
jgi:hypothetical protein